MKCSPRENLWLNLFFNAVAPAVLLSWGSGENRLGPLWGLIVALAFPLGYGLWDLITRKTWNVLSLLGIFGTLMTGGFGFFRVAGIWFAIKEAAVPLAIAAAIPWSLRTRQPLVRLLLYNDQVLNTARIQEALAAKNNEQPFAALLAWASWMLAGAMVVSAVANFGLALWLLPAESGNEAFNRQLGKLQFWSWPVTMLPTSLMIFHALFRLIRGLEELTGLRGDELFSHPSPPPQPTP
ncbi:MAG: VC0807 family protein [Limisphaerales bacterium]